MNMVISQFSSVQFSHSVMFDSATPWTAACQASLSITNSRSLLKLMSIPSVRPSNHLILCLSFLLPPWIFPSIRAFSSESVLHIWWPKYWRFSFSVSPSNEYSGLISLRLTDWISLQSKGLSRVLSNTSVQKHQFFGVHLSYSPTLTFIQDYWKNHSFDYTDLCQQSDISAFNTLSRFVIAFLPRSKCLLISWLQLVS